jgi:hypothetical protein
MESARFDISIPRDDKGNVQGVILGHDFCAEHEWGIDDMLDRFGIPGKPRAIGVNKRRVTVIPEGLTWVKMGVREGILLPTAFDVWYAGNQKADIGMIYWKSLYLAEAKPGLAAAWDKDSFLVTSTSHKDIKALKEVYHAFMAMDAAVTLLSPTVYVGNNLSLIIISRMSKDTIDLWKSYDLEERSLNSYMRRSRIEKLLLRHKKAYFSLRPRRKKDGSVEFWLNPFQQSLYGSGYYTLQDLRAWARDKGKVIKKPETKNSR